MRREWNKNMGTVKKGLLIIGVLLGMMLGLGAISFVSAITDTEIQFENNLKIPLEIKGESKFKDEVINIIKEKLILKKCGDRIFATDDKLHEIKNPVITIFFTEISEVDKLNGLEVNGVCYLNAKFHRYYGDKSSFSNAVWSQWSDHMRTTPISLSFSRMNNRWHIKSESELIIECSNIP